MPSHDSQNFRLGEIPLIPVTSIYPQYGENPTLHRVGDLVRRGAPAGPPIRIGGYGTAAARSCLL